jgi:hypothetical protein
MFSGWSIWDWLSLLESVSIIVIAVVAVTALVLGHWRW